MPADAGHVVEDACPVSAVFDSPELMQTILTLSSLRALATVGRVSSGWRAATEETWGAKRPLPWEQSFLCNSVGRSFAFMLALLCRFKRL